ncbi:MAG: porin [Rhodospirillales bacterium]|nr:porin [Rhodospirillales bacterium]
MKKILMATTAVAAVALASGDAFAQSSAAGPIRLGLGGYFQFYGVFGDQTNEPGYPGEFRHNFDFKREGEIFFTGQTKLDNGLQVGVDVQLEAESCGDQIDESYIWFQGNWGRLILGSENSAAYLLAVGAPSVDANFDSQDPNYRIFNGVVGDPRAGAGGSAIDAWVPLITGDSEKITYLSPRIAGFRAGLSFTPDNSEEASSGQVAAKGGSFAGMPANNTIGQWSNVISAGVNYEGKLGPVDLLAGVGYEYGFLEAGSASLTGTEIFEDRQAWQAGVDLGFAGFHFGGGYYRDDNGVKDDGAQDSWGLGLTYTMGPLTLGASYFNSQRELGGDDEEKLERILVGARYVLGPGVDLRGSVQKYIYNRDDAPGNNAWFGVIGTVLTF